MIALFTPVAALAIFGLLAVYYLFEHLPAADDDGRDEGGNGLPGASRRS